MRRWKIIRYPISYCLPNVAIRLEKLSNNASREECRHTKLSEPADPNIF